MKNIITHRFGWFDAYDWQAFASGCKGRLRLRQPGVGRDLSANMLEVNYQVTWS